VTARPVPTSPATAAPSATRVYVDANKDGDLNQGDMLIQLNGVSRNGLTAGNFSFG
jgi:hypothetical protein